MSFPPSSAQTMSCLPTAAPPKLNLATSLPHELYDAIMAYLLPIPRTKPWDSHSKDLSLVCRAWRDSVQRCILQKAFVSGATGRQASSVAQLTATARKDKRLAGYIRSVSIAVVFKEHSWTVEDLNGLFSALPTLRHLHVYLNDCSPGLWRDYSVLGKAPYLESLSIRERLYDKDSHAYRQLMTATPNISSLTLANDEPHLYEPPSSEQLVPVHLPHLTSLSLHSVQLARKFETLDLLSDETLSGITSIAFEEVGQWTRASRRESRLWGESPLPLLGLIGSHITTLTLIGSKYNGETTEQLLRACPIVSTLVIAATFSSRYMPPTVGTLIYKGGKDVKGQMSLFLAIESDRMDLRNVKRLIVHSAATADFVRESCAELGIKISIEGVTVLLTNMRRWTDDEFTDA